MTVNVMDDVILYDIGRIQCVCFNTKQSTESTTKSFLIGTSTGNYIMKPSGEYEKTGSRLSLIIGFNSRKK